MDLLIMNKDLTVGEWKNDTFSVINSKMLPIYLARSGNVELWLAMRAIDCHRANSRLLKKALRLSERDDISTVISVNAATITDNFWVKPIGSNLKYNDVRFKRDCFASLALTGSYDSFNRVAYNNTLRSPELTNIGSFEKCWKLVDGEWWMYKQANHEELFSELFIYKLGLKLKMNMAEYKRGKKFIKTKDFTNGAKVNFEPAYSFMNDNENYIDNIKYFESLDIDKTIKSSIVGDYVKMLFLDTICGNPDRHTFNYGLLTDSETNKVIELSPNFDNNMALISRGYPKKLKRKNDLLISIFNELMEYNDSFKKYIPYLTEEILQEVMTDINMKVKSKVIIDFIMNGYKQIVK